MDPPTLKMNRSVLNLGSGPSRELPPHFRGFHVVTLDIDATTEPDIVGDARDLSSMADESFDAIYMAHVLETFARWEIREVLDEVTRVLKMGGFVEIHVPNVKAAFEAVLEGHDLETPLYLTGHGAVTPLDLIYGDERSVASGNSFMQHQTAFTGRSLRLAIECSGLRVEFCQTADGRPFELCAIGRKVGDDAELQSMALEEELPTT